MKNFIFLTLFILPINSYCQNLSAHVHGSVHLDMATDKKQLLVMLKSPSESFVGFEYKAKTKEENEKVAQVKDDWTNRLIDHIGKEALKDCKISSSTWKQKFESKTHSSILGEAYIDCQKKVAGRELKITFQSQYPKIQVIKVQLLREDGSVLNKKFKKDFTLKL